MPIKGLIFDFDGTLADTVSICIEAFRRAAEPFRGRRLADLEITATFGPSEAGCARALAPEAPEECLKSYYTHYRKLHEALNEPFEGMRELLDGLKAKGVRLGIVTGKGAHSLEISLAAIGLAEEFDSVEAGCDHGPCKPEGIRNILAEWQLDASDALYVGDAPSDVRSAREAGVAIASVAWADPARVSAIAAERPDHLFERMDQFSEWLRGQGALD